MDSQENELELNTSDGDLFTQPLVLEDSYPLADETIENIDTSKAEEVSEKTEGTEGTLKKTQSSESIVYDEIEETPTTEPITVDETQYDDIQPASVDITENCEPTTSEEILESEPTESLEFIPESQIPNTEDAYEVRRTVKPADKETEKQLDKEPQEIEIKNDTRKRKVSIESEIPEKVSKTEDKVSVSSSDSTVSISVLSGRINLDNVEKSASEETTSSVEIIEKPEKPLQVVEIHSSEEMNQKVEDDSKVSQNGDTIEDDSKNDHSCVSDQPADFSGKISPISKNSGETSTLKYNGLDDSKLQFKKHLLYVEITYSVQETDNATIKNISNIVCDDVTDLSTQFTSLKRVSDISGVMGDVSKNNSPTGSTVSNAGPFPLPNRFSTLSSSSRLSTLSRFSTSSTSSATSSASLLSRLSAFPHQEFLVPDVPNKSKTLSPKSLSHDQIDNLKSHWNNSEQLFKILDAIDNSQHSINVTNGDTDHQEKITTPESKLTMITEVDTPKSEKRSVRKKKPVNRVLPGEEDIPRSASKTSTPRLKSGRKAKRSTSTSSLSDRVSTPEPKKMKKIEEKITPERVEILTNSSGIYVGQKVFAQWADKKFYSGVVDSEAKSKWVVKFDDGSKKALIEDHIIPDCHNNLKGQSVYALNEKTGDYDAGIVTKLWLEQNKVKYEVELDDQSVVNVFAQDIFLTIDQAKAVRELNKVAGQTPPPTPKHHLVTLDNLVEGKRGTRSTKKVTNRNVDSPRPSGSGIRKLKPRKLDSEDDSSFNAGDEDIAALDSVSGVEPELKISTPIKASKGPGRPKGNKQLPNFKSQSHWKNFGPIPENCPIFKDLSFLLVCVQAPVLTDTDASNTETDTETKPFCKIPFLEEHLRQQIQTCGGKLYQHFEEVPSKDYSICKLITNRPNRTAKFIQAIAAGIEVVSHEWVINCCREEKLLPLQELPLGWSLELNQFIEKFQRLNLHPLQNLLVYMAPNSDDQFLKFWERVSTLAGATVVFMDSDCDDFESATFILADGECPDGIVNRALSWNIPILSTTWIWQSIIHGEPRAFNGHPEYSFDYNEYN